MNLSTSQERPPRGAGSGGGGQRSERSGAVEAPRYRQLGAAWERRIARGEWRLGERLPSERDLAAQHGASVGTVRQALALLADAGLLERRHGAGTFVRDPAARRPEQRAPATVGVIVPSVARFFAEVVQGIEDVLRHAGHRLVLYHSNYTAAREQEYLRRALDDHHADGLLLAPTLHNLSDAERAAYLALLRRLGRQAPVVFVERRIDDDDAFFVTSDPAAGGAIAVRHLAALGHRRIAYLGATRSAPSEAIFSGYRAALAEAGAEDDPGLVRRAWEWGRRPVDDEREVLELLQQPRPPTAIFCQRDEHAFAVYRLIRRLGRRVPDDVALVAYDDIVGHLMEVPLTAVTPPKYEVGRQSAELLLRRLAAPGAVPVQQVLLKPALVVRDSCGARRAGA